MTREICKRCGRTSAVGFHVPDDVWAKVSRGRWNVLCVACFAEEGDALRVRWDADIDFYPVSRVTFDRKICLAMRVRGFTP
jgi:hypothetical protein